VVLPYQRYLAGDQLGARNFIAACKATSENNVIWKVILETGALIDPVIIADACRDALLAGADFVKTSTGKTPIGATPEAVAIMLLVVKRMACQMQRCIGVKVSGGVKTIQQAAQYLALAERVMGVQAVTANTFRLGASQLVDTMLNEHQAHE
jgi:deoxyribose-phosphate aldolase